MTKINIKGVFELYPKENTHSWGVISVGRGAVAVWWIFLDHPLFDKDRIAMAGFSRGGKAALWCAAQISGFLVISASSGCTGAAITR